MPRHETLNTAIKSCAWVSEWKIQKDKNSPSISVLYSHSPSIQHSPKQQWWLSMLKYRCCNSSLHPTMDKSQLRTDHMKGRNGVSLAAILQKFLSLWKMGLDPSGDRGIPALISAPSAMFTPPPITMMFWSHTACAELISLKLSCSWLDQSCSSSGSDPVSAHTEGRRKKVLASGMGRGNRSRTMRALL